MKKIMIVAMALASTVAFADHHMAKETQNAPDKHHEECTDKDCKKPHVTHGNHKDHKDHKDPKDHKDEHHDDKAQH